MRPSKGYDLHPQDPDDPGILPGINLATEALELRKEVFMFAKLKKLVGADEESKAKRQEVMEQERREREQRIAENAAALKREVEAEGGKKSES